MTNIQATPASRDQDIAVLRDLAKRYVSICSKPIQEERRNLWRQKNSLKHVRPLIYVRAFAWHEMPQSQCKCEDPFYRQFEKTLRIGLFRDSFDDDYVLEPWITVGATRITPSDGIWGIKAEIVGRDNIRNAGRYDPPIKDLADIDKLVTPHHVVDEASTTRNVERLTDAIGDIITVNVDRGPVYRSWAADISTQLACLRGLDQIMWDMSDNPDWLHSLLAFMRDGILQAHAEAEEADDWRLCNHENQALSYAEELDDPAANSAPVTREKLWNFCASQELAAVGPGMFDEFMLQYQIPVIAKFGLVAYGCCEDLTHKIDALRQVPNLRRIAVSYCADAANCAEQIGTDYVLSYRPSPADMVSYGFDPDRIKSILQRDLNACRDCHFDITLKDVQTVESDPNRIRNWVQLTREVIDELGLMTGD